eukprot:6212180-Pleurochrysis_carterae.AAC.2
MFIAQHLAGSAMHHRSYKNMKNQRLGVRASARTVRILRIMGRWFPSDCALSIARVSSVVALMKPRSTPPINPSLLFRQNA